MEARHGQGLNLGAVADGGGWRFAQPGIRVVSGLVHRLAAHSPVMAAACDIARGVSPGRRAVHRKSSGRNTFSWNNGLGGQLRIRCDGFIALPICGPIEPHSVLD